MLVRLERAGQIALRGGRFALGQPLAQRGVEDKARFPGQILRGDVDLHQQIERQLEQLIPQRIVQQPGGAGIVQRAVGVFQVDVDLAGQRGQAVARGRRHQDRGEIVGVDARVVLNQALARQESRVEADVVADDWRLADEVAQRRDDGGDGRRADDVLRADAGDTGDEMRNGPAGVDQRAVLVDDLTIAQANRADFDDGIVEWVEAGRLQVNRD